jgi:hypothetical protein
MALNASKKELKKNIDLKIEIVVDIDAFQGDQIPADKNAEASYYGLNYGINKNGISESGAIENLFLGDPIPGASELGKYTMRVHHPSGFPSKNFEGLTSPSTGTPASAEPSKIKPHENPR